MLTEPRSIIEVQIPLVIYMTHRSLTLFALQPLYYGVLPSSYTQIENKVTILYEVNVHFTIQLF